MLIIRNALRKAKHLGIDETYYASEGDSGYVWVVRTDRVTFVLAMDSRGGDVIEKYMSDLLHIPVTTDGYSPVPDALQDTAAVLGAHTARGRVGVREFEAGRPNARVLRGSVS